MEPDPNVREYEFSLKNTPYHSADSRKKYNVARFPDGSSVDFASWERPVKMTAEILKGKEEMAQPPTINPSLTKQQKRRQMERFFWKQKEQKNQKIVKNWHLEDANSDHNFIGTLEGQSSQYVLFMMGQDNLFEVIPVNEWYNFKPKKQYTTLSLEQAESTMQQRKSTVDKWMMMKYHKAPREAKTDSTQMNEAEEGETDYHDDFSAMDRLDAFSVKKKDKKKKKGDGENEDEDAEAEEDDDEALWEGMEDKEERGDDPDFDKTVSDDEEIPIDEEEPEEPAPESAILEEKKRLTDSGKEMDHLLKEVGKEVEGYYESEEDLSDEEAEDEYADLRKPQPNAPSTPLPPLEAQPQFVPLPVKIEPVHAVSITSTTSVAEKDKKRPLGSTTTGPVTKKPKIKEESSTTGQPIEPVEEEEVRKALLIAGKIKTKNLIAKFKARIADPEQKKHFAQTVKKLGQIIEEHGEKFVVLKQEYKAGLKPPK